eukprot:4807949-Amphidinium_carterae.4
MTRLHSLRLGPDMSMTQQSKRQDWCCREEMQPAQKNLPEDQQVACYLPTGMPGSKDDSRMLNPALVAPSLWAKALGETLGDIGCTRSKLDPGLFYNGAPNGRSYCVIHVDDIMDDIIVLGSLQESREL